MSVGLREFIKQTIFDVLGGVADAQADRSLGKNVAPSVTYQKLPTHAIHDSGGSLISVTFDVAVTVESTDALAGGAGFKVAVFGMGVSAGGKKGKGSKNAAVTRIQFQVPVLLPIKEFSAHEEQRPTPEGQTEPVARSEPEALNPDRPF